MGVVESRPSAPPSRGLRLRFADVTWLCACVAFACLPLFPIALAEKSVVFELLAWFVFGVQVLRIPIGFVLVGAAAFVAIFARRRRRMAGWLAVLGFVAALPEIRGYSPVRGTWASSVPSDAPSLMVRVFSQNVFKGCADPAALIAEIDRLNPDVVCLQEYSADGHEGLAPLLSVRYPHSLVATTTFVRGTAVYSRLPIDRDRSRSFETSDHSGPWLSVALRVGDETVRLYCLHLSQPKRFSSFRRQRTEMQALLSALEAARGADEPTIVVGDFNATAETYVDQLLHAAGFTDAAHAAGAGTLRTWPSGASATWLRLLALDHVYISADISPIHVEVGRYAASDHRAVVANLCVFSRTSE